MKLKIMQSSSCINHKVLTCCCSADVVIKLAGVFVYICVAVCIIAHTLYYDDNDDDNDDVPQNNSLSTD